MLRRISRLAILTLLGVIALRTIAASQSPDHSARFSVVVSGQGPDVVLIPGLATPGDLWDATVTQLAPTHRVHVVRVAGFGGVDAGLNKAEGDILPALVTEMGNYIAGLERPAVIGHSLGGLNALEVAAQKPDSIGRLLIVDALPFFLLTTRPDATVDMAKQMATMMRNQIMAQTDAQYSASAPMTAARLAKSATARASVAKWAAASDRTVVAKAMYEDLVTDARPRLPQILKHQIDTFRFRTKTNSTWATTSRFGLRKSIWRTGTRAWSRAFGTVVHTRVSKNFSRQKGGLEKWYAFEAESTERALRDWCKANQIHLVDDGSQQSA